MFPTVSGRRSEDPGGRGARVNVVASAVLLASIVLGLVGSRASGGETPLMVMLVVGAILMQAPRIAQQWERAVVLRLGRFPRKRGRQAIIVGGLDGQEQCREVDGAVRAIPPFPRLAIKETARGKRYRPRVAKPLLRLEFIEPDSYA